MYKPHNLTHPSWEDIMKMVDDLAMQVTSSGKELPQLIIGLVRGGAIPAVLLSHKLDIPMLGVNYSSVSGAGDNRNHSNVLPDLPSHISNVLIVDDIADSGKTLHEVLFAYGSKVPLLSTAVLYYKEQSVILPDYVATTIEKDSPFIYFPWE